MSKTIPSSTATGTAFAATYTFLAINGARLSADSQETQDFVLALYEKIISHWTGVCCGCARTSIATTIARPQ